MRPPFQPIQVEGRQLAGSLFILPFLCILLEISFQVVDLFRVDKVIQYQVINAFVGIGLAGIICLRAEDFLAVVLPYHIEQSLDDLVLVLVGIN